MPAEKLLNLLSRMELNIFMPPSSNGLTKRLVNFLENELKQITDDPLKAGFNQFLFKYCIAPQTATGLSPAEILFGCRLRLYLDLLMPTVGRVQASQQQQKANHDGKLNLCELGIGELCMSRSFTGTAA